MAQSLVCNDCGLQLKSVKEATDHNEATGHADFAESVEKVLNMVCEECGKPCRNKTQQDLHSKHTGHTKFVDKTNEVAPMDTEAQMRDARAEQNALPESSKSDDVAAAEDAPLVEPKVNEELLQQLQEMGFSKHKAIRALHFSGTDSLEQAITWIMEHEADPDLDEPLLVPEVKEKPKLSAEEARKQAEEALRKAKQKREKEERELEKVRESEQRRATKELMAAQRLEDEQRLKRSLDERMRAKAEEARARDKIRLKLEEDRKERRRKLGLPEELTEAEKEAERARLAESAKAKPTIGLPVKPVSLLAQMREVLVDMKKTNAGKEEQLKTCWSTMLKYIGNIAKDPKEDKFRKIRVSNAAFQSRVASMSGALKFLELIGFHKEDDFLVMPAEKATTETLIAAGGELNNACTNPFFGVL